MSLRPTTPLLAALALTLLLGACGDSTERLSQEAQALEKHYAENPPDRGWKVLGVSFDAKDDKLVVQVLVTSEADVNQIKSFSRMEQFSSAKHACPEMTPKLRAAIDKKTRIWVRLQTKKKELTSSICPG